MKKEDFTMTNEEKRKIADIIEAFGYINQDIRGAYNRLTDLLEQKKDFQAWKKDEDGKKKTKDNYYDFDAFCKGDGLWYYMNTYGAYKGKVIGFTFVVTVDYDEKDFLYQRFINTLDESINKKAPMLLIYGIYEPVKNTENFFVIDENEEEYNIVDSILGLSDDWKTYNPEMLKYDTRIDVQIEYKENDEILEGCENWYKNAIVKIRQIQDISSAHEAEKIIVDLIEIADDYIQKNKL